MNERLTLEELLRTYGPYFNGEPPTDDAVYSRLDAFGAAWWRCESPTQRETARQLWADFFREHAVPGVSQPWRVVQEAIAAGRTPKTEGGRSFPWRTLAELRTQPAAVDLIAGYLPEESLVVPFGPAGCGKTFLAVDIASCVATGTSWHGRAVRQGAVLYIAAEGGRRIVDRFDAWLEAHGQQDAGELHVLQEPVRLLEANQAAALLSDVQTFDPTPKLVVIDTLSQCLPGGDENAVKDMGTFVDVVNELRRATGVTVLANHHTGKDGRVERGSTAVRGAADTMIKLSDEESVITVTCDKQRDGPPFDALRFRLKSIGESCVLEPTTELLDTDELTPKELEALKALHSVTLADEGVSSTAWESVSSAQGISRATYHRVRKTLIVKGYIEKRKSRYLPTSLGLRTVGPEVPF